MKTPLLTFRPEDFTENGQFSAQKLSDCLNRITKSMREALNKGITEDNQRQQSVAMTVQTKAAVETTFPLDPIQLAAHMPSIPNDVRVESVENLTNPTETWTAAVSCNWKPVGNRSFRVTYISGLTASTKYRVTLRVT